MRPVHLLISVAAAASAVASIASCSSSSSSATATASDFDSTFPSSLVVSSPTAQQASSLAIMSGTPSAMSLDGTESFEEKKEALEELLSADSATACAINVTLASAGRANCYGPSMTFANHPDSTTDAPGGDLGIWTASETSSGEACAAAQLNTQIKGVASQVDAGLFSLASMICAAETGKKALPETGASLDLTSDLAGKVTIDGSAATVTSASLSREDDTADGKPVYVSSLELTTGTKAISIRLKHISTADDNSTYQGKLSLKIANTAGPSQGNCPHTGGETDAVSIAYDKSSATSMTYQLKSGNFCGSSADPWVSATDYSVDLAGKTYNSGSRPNGWANNGNYTLANVQPVTGDATLLYAWQAGSGDSHTRVFNAKVDMTAETGVAYFGFGPQISSDADYSDIGSILGFICKWYQGSHTPSNYVQKQTLALTSGKFTAASSKITFDPVDSCESSSGTFTMTPSGGSAVAANTTTMDLASPSDIASNITAPSLPENVDE